MALVVVSDSSPLIILSKIPRLEVLRLLFGQIIIPSAVQDELLKRRARKSGADQLAQATWIITQRVKDDSATERLRQRSKLGAGEAEAIVLAEETGADVVLLDEQTARKVAQSRELKVLGTLGILERAYEEGLLPNFGDIIKNIHRHGFYLSEELIKASLERFNIPT